MITTHRTNMRAVRLRGRHALIEEMKLEIGPPNRWGATIRKIMTQNRHPRHHERYVIMTFLYGNMGINPIAVAHLVLNAWVFDKSATRSIMGTALDFQKGKHFQFWNVLENKVTSN